MKASKYELNSNEHAPLVSKAFLCSEEIRSYFNFED